MTTDANAGNGLVKNPSSAVDCCLLFAALRCAAPGSEAFDELARTRIAYWSAGREQAWANAWTMALARASRTTAAAA